MKVLIVDDDRDVRDLLVGFLEFEEDLEPVLAENGLVAKHILQEEVVAAAMVDLSMPVMNGLELLKWLQQDGPAIPVIMMSGYGRMPVGGDFFDTIIRQEPIDDNNLNPEDNLEEFGPIDDDTLQYLKQEADRLKDSPRFAFGNFGGTAIGDIALVPAPFLKYPKGIRDIEEWYISTVSRRDYLHQIFSRQTEIALENLPKIYAVVGDVAGLAYICGTDFGTQTGTFCSPRTYKNLYHPYYQQINEWVHANTSWKTFKHSCGAVEKFMPLFIESGFDIINPVQCSAAGMNPQILKERYGDQLVFWGGGGDTQQTLPFGTPDDARAEVLSRCEVFAPNGGFVFNAIHNVLPNTPVENFVAMIDAVNEFNGKRP